MAHGYYQGPRQVSSETEIAYDTYERDRCKQCIRLAKYHDVGTSARLFYLRLALLHNAVRWNNWNTVSELYVLTNS